MGIISPLHHDPCTSPDLLLIRPSAQFAKEKLGAAQDLTELPSEYKELEEVCWAGGWRVSACHRR
jgi:hypothetical protein